MAKVEKRSKIRLALTEREAEELKSIVMNTVDWEDHHFGTTAKAIYYALHNADVAEA